MLPVKWSQESLADLAEIQFYIEQFNPVAAVTLRRNIEDAVAHFLSAMPYAARDGRVPGIREYVVHPSYIVFYQVTDSLNILRVKHTRRQYP